MKDNWRTDAAMGMGIFAYTETMERYGFNPAIGIWQCPKCRTRHECNAYRHGTMKCNHCGGFFEICRVHHKSIINYDSAESQNSAKAIGISDARMEELTIFLSKKCIEDRQAGERPLYTAAWIANCNDFTPAEKTLLIMFVGSLSMVHRDW